MWILLWFLPVCHLLDWVILSWYIIWVYHWVTFTCWYRCTIGTSSGIKPSRSCLYASLYDNLKSILASFQFFGDFHNCGTSFAFVVMYLLTVQSLCLIPSPHVYGIERHIISDELVDIYDVFTFGFSVDFWKGWDRELILVVSMLGTCLDIIVRVL